VTGGPGPELRTARLLLRRWRDTDRDPFARLNADPAVMEHFPATLSTDESERFASRIEEVFDLQGFGLWAVEVPGVASFIGFIGLSQPQFDAAFTPCVEIGWRLAAEHWGRGYASEGAQAVLEFGFHHLELDEIVSFTTVANDKSQRVMQKIGMHRDPAEDFDHPATPGWHGQRHVLYRLTDWDWWQRRARS